MDKRQYEPHFFDSKFNRYAFIIIGFGSAIIAAIVKILSCIL